MVLFSCNLAAAAGPVLDTNPTLGSTHYTIYYGDAAYLGVAQTLVPYLNSSYNTAENVIGYNQPNLNIYFYSAPGSNIGGYSEAGVQNVWLNTTGGTSTNAATIGQYSSVVAHETGHVLFFDETGITNVTPSVDWFTEALSYYIGDSADPYGTRYTKAQIGSELSVYSNNGATKEAWNTTGTLYLNGNSGNLEWWQLNAIGTYLESLGSSKVQAVIADIGQGMTEENAFIAVYGMPTGDDSTAAGPMINTLYSNYINYYYGTS